MCDIGRIIKLYLQNSDHQLSLYYSACQTCKRKIALSLPLQHESSTLEYCSYCSTQQAVEYRYRLKMDVSVHDDDSIKTGKT